jgi:hypothetical protein
MTSSGLDRVWEPVTFAVFLLLSETRNIHIAYILMLHAMVAFALSDMMRCVRTSVQLRL